MRVDQLERLTVSEPHLRETLAAVQSHCAYTSAHNRAQWLARVDTNTAEPALPAIRVSTSNALVRESAEDDTKEVKRNEIINVNEGGSKLLSDMHGCTINLYCKLQQLRLTRVVDTTVYLQHAVTVALEECSNVRFIVLDNVCVKVRDFTPNHQLPNYTITRQ